MAVELRELARNTIVLFGITCACEATFSQMNYLKRKYGIRLIDNNLDLESGIRLNVSSEFPDISCLSANDKDQGILATNLSRIEDEDKKNLLFFY